MQKVLTTIFAFFVALCFSQAQAEVSVNKRLDFKSIKRIIALEKNQESLGIENVSEHSRYRAEFEKGVSGRLAAYQTADIGIKVGVGVGFEAGAFVLGSKEVPTKEEAEEFVKGNIGKVIDPTRFDEWEKGEQYQFIVEGAIIIDPTIECFGIWTVIKGSWSLEVVKKSVSKAQVTVTLLNSNTASFYVDLMWNMVSFDIGNVLSKGITLEIDFDTEEGQEAYRQLLVGNMKTAQEFAKEAQGVEQLSSVRKDGVLKGTSLYSRSPLTAWYLMTWDFHIEEFDKQTTEFKTQKVLEEIVTNYVEDQKLKLFSYYQAKLRQFTSNYQRQEKTYSFKDEWHEEFNRDFEGQMRNAYSNLKQKVKIDFLPNISIPVKGIKGFSQFDFSFTYSPKFVQALKNSQMDYEELANNSVKLMEKERLPMTKYYAMGTGPYIAEQIKADKVYIPLRVKKLQSFIDELKGIGETEATREKELLILAKISKLVYSDPYIYKYWLEQAMTCGGELNFSISGESFKKLEFSQTLPERDGCLQ